MELCELMKQCMSANVKIVMIEEEEEMGERRLFVLIKRRGLGVKMVFLVLCWGVSTPSASDE